MVSPYLITPTLSSDTSNSPNFVVSTSSVFDANYSAYKLFDGLGSGYWASRPETYSAVSPYIATSLDTFNTGSTVINGSWVKITLNEQKKFNYYRLAQTSTIFPAPGDFTIYGSNDNLAYTTINQQTDYGIVGTDNVWSPKILVGEQQYKYIVFQVTKLKNGGGGSIVSVWDLGIGYDPAL